MGSHLHPFSLLRTCSAMVHVFGAASPKVVIGKVAENDAATTTVNLSGHCAELEDSFVLSLSLTRDAARAGLPLNREVLGHSLGGCMVPRQRFVPDENDGVRRLACRVALGQHERHRAGARQVRAHRCRLRVDQATALARTRRLLSRTQRPRFFFFVATHLGRSYERLSRARRTGRRRSRPLTSRATRSRVPTPAPSRTVA